MNSIGSMFKSLILFIACLFLIGACGAFVGTVIGGNTDSEPEHEHDYVLTVIEPTCTEQGYTTYTCECGDEYVSDSVNATGHDWSEWVETVAPTCEAGEKMRVCQTDGSHTETQTILPAHGFSDGVCSLCSAFDPNYGATPGLSFNLNADAVSYSCSGLGIATDTDIVIPSTYKGLPVTSIVNSAFYNKRNLTSLTIPDSVTSISSNAFTGCSGLKSVIMLSATPPTLGTTIFDLPLYALITVPVGCGEAYKSATNWSYYASRIVEKTE